MTSGATPSGLTPSGVASPRLALPAMLAMLNAVGPISTDMYLPAFPAMRAALGGGAAAAPLTLAAWFAGIAIGQLLLGPLSDRTGRKAPLLLGGAVYVIGCAGCALSASMGQLIAWRLLAAAGGAASLVVPRAIIRDVVLDAGEAARIVATVQILMSAAPMLTPALGGLLVQASGWRSIFVAATFYGVACLALVVFAMPETLPPAGRMRLQWTEVAARYRRIGIERDFATHAMTGAAATFGLFAFLGGAPVVFLHHFGMSPTSFGLTFVANSVAYAAGARLNAVLTERLGNRRSLTGAVLALVAAAATMLACAAGGWGGLWGIEGPFVAIMLVLGCVLPGAAIGAIGPHLNDAGIASALYGTAVFAVGALGTIAVGFAGGSDPVPMACLMLAGALLAVATAAVRPTRNLDAGFD